MQNYNHALFVDVCAKRSLYIIGSCLFGVLFLVFLSINNILIHYDLVPLLSEGGLIFLYAYSLISIVALPCAAVSYTILKNQLDGSYVLRKKGNEIVLKLNSPRTDDEFLFHISGITKVKERSTHYIVYGTIVRHVVGPDNISLNEENYKKINIYKCYNKLNYILDSISKENTL